jgi:hypothetical protein
MAFCTFVALCMVGVSATALQADLPGNDRDLDEMVVGQLPIEAPDGAEVLRALPKKAARDNIVVVAEGLAMTRGPVRFYAGLGNAVLEESHFKCTVFSSAGVEVVYIDRSRLRSAP